jgi:hypothetical protein
MNTYPTIPVFQDICHGRYALDGKYIVLHHLENNNLIYTINRDYIRCVWDLSGNTLIKTLTIEHIWPSDISKQIWKAIRNTLMRGFRPNELDIKYAVDAFTDLLAKEIHYKHKIRIIQRKWREATANPYTIVGKNRLLYEYNELNRGSCYIKLSN